MKKSLAVLLLSAMLAPAASVLAQAPPASTTLSVRGTIDAYDASSRTLALATSSGTVRFPVASTTRISQGGRKVEASELQKLAGNHVTVRYTESDGHKVVESVHVFGK
jgi:type 1 fimbria pilin